MLNAILLFILAGLAEIGGGYLVWLWLREAKPFWYGIIGALILILYGIIPTFPVPYIARIKAWSVAIYSKSSFATLHALILVILVSGVLEKVRKHIV